MENNDMNTNPIFGSEKPVSQPSMVAENKEQEDLMEEEHPFQIVGGIKTVVLYKPITVNGKEITELTLNYDALTASDLDNIEAAALASKGMNPGVMVFTSKYTLRVAAKAAGINYNDLKQISAKDASRLSLITRNFLQA